MWIDVDDRRQTRSCVCAMHPLQNRIKHKYQNKANKHKTQTKHKSNRKQKAKNMNQQMKYQIMKMNIKET